VAFVKEQAMRKRRICLSFSGGKTSAMMTVLLWLKYRSRYNFIVTFANTGEENEATLVFVDKCDRYWNLGVIWLEAVVHHDERIGSTHRIVNFKTASRDGDPFEEVIKKYGIPNKAYPHCTRELKENPIRSYLRSIGWEAGSYHIAIGIRADEQDRRVSKPERIYPLIDWAPFRTTKPEVNLWWEEQPFNLDLQEHQGNCKTCWKKSFNKLVRIATETPQYFEFNQRMERLYGLNGHHTNSNRRVFFRGNTSTASLLQMAHIPTPPPKAEDENWGCSESCEAFG
jgi:hypothetical protein